jgi:PAS domain S-box-containing protein
MIECTQRNTTGVMAKVAGSRQTFCRAREDRLNMDTAESAVAGRSEVLEMGAAYRPLVDVLVATCPLVAAVLLRWLLDPQMGDTFPLVTLFGAVAAAVCMGGYRPALLVVTLGYAACAYLFIEPRHSFIASEPRHLIGLALYLVTCSIIICIGEALRASKHRLADHVERLKDSEERLRETLRYNDKRNRALVSILADLPWQADPAGHLIAPQPEQNQFSGTTEEQNSGEGWANSLHPDDRERVKALWRHAVETGTYYESRGRIWHAASQSYHHYIGRAIPVRNDDGTIREWVGAITDVHEQMVADQRWRTMTEALPNLVWTDLPDGQCDWLSTQWGKYTGIPEKDLLGLRWLETVIHPDDRERTLACWRAACADEGDYDLEYRIRRYDGEYRWFKTRGAPMRNEQGKIVYWFGTCTDIEDAKRQEAALREADRRKDEFLAMLGHELRNPLAAVRNAIAVAGLDDTNRPRALDIARRQADQLGRLIDDLLDVARVTQGRIVLHKQRVDVQQLIDRAVDSARGLIESRALRIVVQSPSEPMAIEADPIRFEQVLGNLLSNAVKYSDVARRIDVTVARHGDEVAIRISDTGIGIAPEMLPHVWDLFAQGPHALDRAKGGLGIGLTVVRRIVELHGGRTEARSAGIGKGAEFVVWMPTLAPAKEDVAPASVPQVGPPGATRVLLVEDNADAAEAATLLLQALGHRVHVVYDGIAALQAARAMLPDVMLVDIGLPGIDGYEVARRVRARSCSPAHGARGADRLWPRRG